MLGVTATGPLLVAVDLPSAPSVKRTLATPLGRPQSQVPRSISAGPVLTAPGPQLVAIDLPHAPRINRAVAAPVRRAKLPAIGLLAVGVLLLVGPIVGGLFAKAAAGEQMIDQFAPYMQPGALSRYRADVVTLQRGTSGIGTVYRQQHLPAGRFPLLDNYRLQSTAIVDRASGLLDLVSATEPDYQRVYEIGGFDRLPFLIVLAGIVAICGGCVLLVSSAGRARTAAVLVVLTSVAVAGYPFVGGLYSGASAGNRMLRSLTPVMTSGEVRQLQSDFVVLVEAVGELETSFRGVARTGAAATDVGTLVNKWPTISSDLASLVGVIEDNLGNFNALENLDAVTRGVGVPGLVAFPWLLVGVGTLGSGLAVAAWPHTRRER
jgi:hypothetical protein